LGEEKGRQKGTAPQHAGCANTPPHRSVDGVLVGCATRVVGEQAVEAAQDKRLGLLAAQSRGAEAALERRLGSKAERHAAAGLVPLLLKA
jgi:hypothetical protein